MTTINNLCKIRNIQRSIIAFETNFSKRYNMSLNEGMLLCLLLKEERLSSGKLSEMLSLTPSNTSKVILLLEKKGYISRVMDQQDKRKMLFTITLEGKKQLENIKCENIELDNTLKELIKED